ncbi:glucosamine-6-phosphate deaminase, partial [Peribacillus simplex]|nr:glucosamine-6-phosphate deaminase [Peribacillus sp. Aquil_B8]
KAETLKKLIHGDISEEFPASILKKHNNVTIIADQKALSGVIIP